MSKYNQLWENIKVAGESRNVLNFSEVKDILGFELDHSLLNFKKELLNYGYQIIKISLKDKKIFYKKI